MKYKPIIWLFMTGRMKKKTERDLPGNKCSVEEGYHDEHDALQADP